MATGEAPSRPRVLADGRIAPFDSERDPRAREQMRLDALYFCLSDIAAARAREPSATAAAQYAQGYAVAFKYRLESDPKVLVYLSPPEVAAPKRSADERAPLLPRQGGGSAQPAGAGAVVHVVGAQGPKCFRCNNMATLRCQAVECCEECPNVMCVMHSRTVRNRGAYNVCDMHEACTVL
jgi:hypothetical protein